MRPSGLGAALVLLAAVPASAYVRVTVSSADPSPVSWDLSAAASQPEVSGGRLTYRLDPSGSADVQDGSDLAALERAFASWEALPDTELAFQRGSDLASKEVTNDESFPVFWVESSSVVDQGTSDPSDDIDIGGALAVTFTWWSTGGTLAGRIVDANIVFNGFDHSWTTDPAAEPGRFDIESVAAHEIGHALGFGHSVVGGATMFPRTGAGVDRSRTLSRDDHAAAGASYGTGAWSAAQARLAGVVTLGGSPVRGAHVVVEDADGNVVAGTMSAADGSYEIDGLPAGNLRAWVEPIDRADGSTVLFNEWNLPSYWRGGVVELDFRSSAARPFVATPGASGVLDFAATAGPPGRNITLLGVDGFLANSPAALEQGVKDAFVTVAGPVAEVPSTGTPLSVSGDDFTIKATDSQTFNGGTWRWVRITVDVDPDAPPGLRSLVLDDGNERTLAAGHLEVLPSAAPPDADGDGVLNAVDNCPNTPNAGQEDRDGDGEGDACDGCPDDPADDPDGDGTCDDADNCPGLSNPGQEDADGDGAGDACDPCPADARDDPDGDGTCEDVDNCPGANNPGQEDADGDGAGDACDPCPADAADDADGDGRCAEVDNCPSIANPGQADGDGDGAGDACDACPADAADDSDGDGHCADRDNCPDDSNPGQADGDGDEAGDACDPCPADALDDADGDGHCADGDNCPAVTNPGQEDADGDGRGDACDPCPADAADDADGDGRCADADNCPSASNPGQENADGDALGDACDPCPADPSNDCVSVNLLRNDQLTQRSAAQVQEVFTRGRNGGLDPVADLAMDDVGGSTLLVVRGDGAVVGVGRPGVLVFYDAHGALGTLRVERQGADVLLSGW